MGTEEMMRRDWQAMLSLGLDLPYTGSKMPYDQWAARLITRGDWKQADEVVQPRLSCVQIVTKAFLAFSNDSLLALHAMILAERSEFGDALKAATTVWISAAASLASFANTGDSAICSSSKESRIWP